MAGRSRLLYGITITSPDHTLNHHPHHPHHHPHHHHLILNTTLTIIPNTILTTILTTTITILIATTTTTTTTSSTSTRTWPEHGALAEELVSGKGRLVTSEEQAMAEVRAGGAYMLWDTENVKDAVFKDYMEPKATTEPLCGLTYTEEFRWVVLDGI